MQSNDVDDHGPEVSQQELRDLIQDYFHEALPMSGPEDEFIANPR